MSEVPLCVVGIAFGNRIQPWIRFVTDSFGWIVSAQAYEAAEKRGLLDERGVICRHVARLLVIEISGPWAEMMQGVKGGRGGGGGAGDERGR